MAQLPGAGPERAAVDRADESLKNFIETKPEGDDYVELAERVASYRAALVAFLTARAEDAEIDEDLTAGDFIKAVKTIDQALNPRTRSPEATRGSIDPGVLSILSQMRLRRLDGATDPATEAPAPLSVFGPNTAFAGERITVRAVLPSIDASEVVIEWSVSGVSVTGISGSKDKVLSFVPQEVGVANVRCVVLSDALPGKVTAQIGIRIESSAQEEAVLNLRRRIDEREILMSLITGVLIAGIGVMIFENEFVGTFRNYMYAAIWGFTTDIGAARLRTLAKPLLGRTLPATSSSPASG